MKQFFGLMMTVTLALSMFAGNSHTTQDAEAATKTDVQWLKQVKEQAAAGQSVDKKATLRKTTLAQLHRLYKGEKDSKWCQSGNGLVTPDASTHYCAEYGVTDSKAKVEAIVYDPGKLKRTLTVNEVKQVFPKAKVDKMFNVMIVPVKDVNIYLNLNSKRTQVVSVLVKYE